MSAALGETTAEELPQWVRTRVQIATSEGMSERDAYTHPYIDGLAVTLSDGMRFSCTHRETGKRFGPTSLMAMPVAIFLIELALICDILGVPVSDPSAAREEMLTFAETPVPFDGATSTDRNGTRPLTLREWWSVAFALGSDDPEFPDIVAIEAREEALMLQLHAKRTAGAE